MSLETSILVINPNSTQSVTDGLIEVIRSPPGTKLAFYTGPPDAPPSIDDAATSTLSSTACMRDIRERGMLDQYDGFLVSCFSDHPLTHALREVTDKPVLGIFQASLAHALLCGNKFGILTDGSWVRLRRWGRRVLGSKSDRFCGVGGERVESKMKEGSAELAALGVDVVILGCAGMSGMENLVHTGFGGDVRVVDGNKAGVELLAALVRLGN
ncbi:Asp/Glu/hydantoin racemase [Roridomyces roridus]|uniref:Asp/Glu/hydantoin racemase n=1 Tax=Roridomyces roridus TaxID=1738132 RepID=A0AAD7FPH0_9AGAR|nr:Asp/Glu/hydantoin racemase [Roridomyces roridus]